MTENGFSPTRAMKTGYKGWQRLVLYIKSGSLRTGWINDGNTWYYLDGSGKHATGWLDQNNQRYFLSPRKRQVDKC